jgi:hypothetical protein
MSSNRIYNRWRRSRRSGIPFPPKPSNKSAYNEKMKTNTVKRIERRTSKNRTSQRKQWANSLKGKMVLPKARSPMKKSPMEISNDYEELKYIRKIKTGLPNKIFPNAPSVDSMSKLRELLKFVKDKKVIKLIKDDMVRILVNSPVIRTDISTVEQLDDYLHGTNSKVERLFTDAEIENYLTLFQMTTKKDIQKESKSVFTNTD